MTDDSGETGRDVHVATSESGPWPQVSPVLIWAQISLIKFYWFLLPKDEGSFLRNELCSAQTR